MMLALALLAADPVAEWDGLPIPDEAGVAVGDYIGCLFDPLEPVLTTGQPADEAGRAKLVANVMAECRPLRDAASRQAEARLATVPGWTEPALRRAKIERMLAAAEERTSFSIVSREAFLDMAERIRRCVMAGRKDCAQ